MQISVDVHNYMETLVGQVLATEEYVSSYNNEQLADLACLALGQLKPIYIRFDIDFLSALPEEKLVLYKRNSEIAVKNAESMIIDDRRRERDDNVPVIFSQHNFDDDVELQWYEKPLLNRKQS
ncbi:late competence development ComFB family protein [Vibrio splendidus]|uniref:late competence development ComFB family protein n=1 Tax=Vibrio splendidus TaxID=29497 RepID=UPI0002EE6950|nr:late competence development ComFB family protein [Vibrio splendidus]MDP2590026.1 late competence development ComFB family protein [Vibrio splendidus]OEE53539.1 competence protein ComFB [Vibrio splendidus FF-500]